MNYKVYSQVEILGKSQIHSLWLPSASKEIAENMSVKWYANHQPTWVFVKHIKTVEL